MHSTDQLLCLLQVSSKVDLGQGHEYSAHSAVDGQSFTASLTTPHADWRSVEARASHQGSLDDFKSSTFFSSPLLKDVSASVSTRYTSPFDLTAAAALDTPLENIKHWKVEVRGIARGLGLISEYLFVSCLPQSQAVLHMENAEGNQS